MGSFSSKMFDTTFKQAQRDRIDKLLELTPETLLCLAVEDPEIYEACKGHDILRHSFITAAVKKYQAEKFVCENVYNRTAKFTVMLDEFLQIQDEIRIKKERKTFGLNFFKRFLHSQRGRVGDETDYEAQDGGDSTKGGAEGKAAMKEITYKGRLEIGNSLNYGELFNLELDEGDNQNKKNN